jgi:hypothetical protein
MLPLTRAPAPACELCADERASRRELPLAAILMRACAHMGTKPGHLLNLLDLRGSGCVEIGAPTDAVRARHLAAGQALGRAVYEEHGDVDGLMSREQPSLFCRQNV